MTKRGLKHTDVSITRDLYERLREEAKRRGCSIVHLVRLALVGF